MSNECNIVEILIRELGCHANGDFVTMHVLYILKKGYRHLVLSNTALTVQDIPMDIMELGDTNLIQGISGQMLNHAG